MHILVNGTRREDLETRHAGLLPGDLLEILGTEFFRAGQLVVGVHVDGTDVTGADRSDWGQRAGVQELALLIQTPGQLLAGSLKVSLEWLPLLRTELGSCADRFRLGEDAQALDALIRVVEGLRLLFLGIGQIQRLLLNQELASSALVEGFQAEIPRLLDEIIASQEGRDWILLADLLEYDVMDQLTRWEETAAALLEELA